MSRCILCGAGTEKINIGKSPLAGYAAGSIEESLHQPAFELNMEYCPSCNFVRYEQAPGADSIISKMYRDQQTTYSLTPKNESYIKNMVLRLADKYRLAKEDTVLEIGCNDGAMLKLFKTAGCKVLGIEPSNSLSSLWQENDIPVYNDFFTSACISKLKAHNFKIIILRHVLEHIWDIHSFIENVYQLVDSNTVFVIEVPYFLSVLRYKRIDNVGYSHANYFTVKSINRLLTAHGLGIESFYPVETDGGSMVVFAGRGIHTDEQLLDSFDLKELYAFREYINNKRDQMKGLLGCYARNEIIGYGAGPKGQHLIHLLRLQKYLNVVVNDLEYFQGKYIPGTKIYIGKPSEYLHSRELKAVINLAPTHGDALRPKIPGHLEFIELV